MVSNLENIFLKINQILLKLLLILIFKAQLFTLKIQKKVLVFFVTEENQTKLDSLVQDFFASYNLQDQFNSIRPQTPDEGRRFHISYANTTGNPFDSIAVVW